MPLKRRRQASRGGLERENAGMSNERKARNLSTDMPKVSWVKLIFPGSVGT